jgi:hypothetical protein
MVGYCGLAQIAEVATELCMILLMLTMLLLAAIGDPMEGCTPEVFDQARGKIRIGSGISQHCICVFQLKGTLFVILNSHSYLREQCTTSRERS